MQKTEKITDQDFRIAVTEIAIQAREASKAWAKLRTHLDLGPEAERPARLKALREAYSRKHWMSLRVLDLVSALSGTSLFPEWAEKELERIPELLEAAGRRQHER
jgi:hypothetical protein